MTSAQRIEWMCDLVAAALFAAAAGYVLRTLTGSDALAASGLALAGIACLRILRSVEPQKELAPFEPFDVRLLFAQADELLLTDAERLREVDPDELLLDDVLERPAPDSRVVRLFDRSAMPTPGELVTRIDRHLVGQALPNRRPDASQDLIEALAELRRSLR